MQIRDTDERTRRWDRLEDATGEATTSGAIDKATRYYLRMAGGHGRKHGVLTELMDAAVERGSLTPEEIAAIVDTAELAVEYEHSYSVGKD